MTAHQTWWDYNAHRFARYGVRKRNSRLIVVALAAVFLIFALSVAHAERGLTSYGCAAMDISGNVLSMPCDNATRLGSLRYTRGPGGGSSGAIIAVGLDGQAAMP